MKNRKIAGVVAVILLAIIVIVVELIFVSIRNSKPVGEQEQNAVPEEQQEQLADMEEVYVWKMEYDEAGNLLSEIVNSSFGYRYKYDEKGNRTEIYFFDDVYEDFSDTTIYEYDDEGRITVQKGEDWCCEYDYSDSERVVATEQQTQIQYIYKISDGRVVSVEETSGLDFQPLIYECEYDNQGQLVKLKAYEDNDPYEYTYKYDSQGRYEEITFVYDDINFPYNMTAKFTYEKKSNNKVANVYNEDGKLINRYTYQYDKGKLTEVRAYVADDNSEWWRENVRQHFEWGYPGGEVPYNFFE